ncbi:hypothetical protein QB607_003277 [Clostridium botulinum]|nr:hypothetical protein [Clostridium botulinum]EKS4395949.1 hypothetical protein [Clostridium botulinum]
MVIKKWTGCKKAYKLRRKSEGDETMATMTKNTSSNIFEFTIAKDSFNSIIKKLEEPGLTKEYLNECKRIAELYKKPSKDK